jgi:hypothetical protein
MDTDKADGGEEGAEGKEKGKDEDGGKMEET